MIGSGDFDLPNTKTLTYCNDVDECCTHTGITGFTGGGWHKDYLNVNDNCYHFPAPFLNRRPGYPKVTVTTHGMVLPQYFMRQKQFQLIPRQQ